MLERIAPASWSELGRLLLWEGSLIRLQRSSSVQDLEENMPFKFVKRDKLGNPVILTSYEISDEAADEVLQSLRRFDDIAVRMGYSWEKVPSDTGIVAVPEHVPEKMWDSPVMHGEPPTVGGVVPDETYVRRMAANGVDEEEALRLRKFIESIL